MTKISLVSLVSLILLSGGVILGIILLINLFNGNVLEMQYVWNGMSISEQFYQELLVYNETGAYAYQTISGTGETMFRLCGACFVLGIALVIIPPFIKKK